MTNTPFTIELVLNDESTISATLRNHSTSQQFYLESAYLQRSELLLISEAGHQVLPFDSRSIRRYDKRYYPYNFITIEPDGYVPLGSSLLQETEEGRVVLVWGPFRFDGLEPGQYAAQVVWQSSIETLTDPETNAKSLVPGVWLGTVKSDVVSLTIR